MPSLERNNYGTIVIDNEVVARIAGLCVMGSAGVVGMAAKNVKDGLVHLLKIESLTKGVKLNMDGGGLCIGLHVIVEYGTNISAIADSLISNVKYKVEEFTGLSVKQIDIFVEGIRIDS
ncbi:MAG: Asp23/Gls24 family envelope stress response protein [Clostridiales bacterium]|nr:Asp23/Gls24 family envelope stress response protein [Clostridiales bacterium]